MNDSIKFGNLESCLLGVVIGAIAALIFFIVSRAIESRTVECELCKQDSSVQVYDSHGGKYGMCDGCIRKALKIDGEGKDGK